ncbi:autotransporter outer membrane beta-barrel domain-containing protein [Fusobacterium sp.]|uniref:autotransporter outer membrane beta-barrel domain-containing protein n=1 Tax=Fusobacterium sp. TaxID=68766 RepID=UPI0029000D5C|nr:autotransporter domain-containing protein [Fusobacterium sp.]MDU1910180.1 autotransporter domain-containing protein [Fusobacterium sp.]
MIDQLMKTVKRGNKKRSLNITIGAVVGFLLSCTAVMGADNYLWIKDNNGKIEFNTEKTTDIDGEDGIWKNENPYSENTWNTGAKTYVNNMILSSSENNGKDKIENSIIDISYGLRLSGNLSGLNFINNSSITGTGNSFGYGLILEGNLGKLNLINNGNITGTSSAGSGIYLQSSTIDGYINNNGSIIGATSSGIGISLGIFLSGSTIKGAINNSGSITGTGAYAYGIYLSNSSTIKGAINNSGSIVGTGGAGSGIYLSNSSTIKGNINNSGSITGTGSVGSGYGIYLNNSTEGNINNSGSITGISTGSAGYGIYLRKSTIEGDINNSGNITGNNVAVGFGIYLDNSSSIKDINNNGSIAGTGYGIWSNNPELATNINNSGVIFGTTSALNLTGNEKINNYGFLVSEKRETVSGVSSYSNHGLIFKANESGYIDNSSVNMFGEKNEADGYIIINTNADVDDDSKISNMKSLVLENGTISDDDSNDDNNRKEEISSEKRYVLNGIEDTLKVTGIGNELNNSVVNAYKTAIVMDKDMSTFTLNNTVVNGGILDESTVNISGDRNTLTIQGDSTINSNGNAITVSGDNNAVTLEGNAVVNGKMESTGNNTLNLYGKTDDSRNILHDISGFVNMNIDNNVTFFEDVKVTGTDTVTVYQTGVLNLKLKKDDTARSTIPTAAHAFSGTDGMTIKGTSAEEAGILNFITNGIGREIIVDMENIELENMKVKANSIIDRAEIHKDYIHLGAGSDLSGIVNPRISRYDSLNKIYKSLYSSTDEKNIDALRNILAMTFLGENYDYNNGNNEEQLKNLMSYLGNVYTETPYSFSSELSRKSMGMFRDVVTENDFRPDLNKWMIMGGLTHGDGGTKDTYYGQNYHGFDTGTADTDMDMKLSGAYALGKYGYSENVSLGITVGGNRSEAELSMSRVKGNSGYIGIFAENYRGNLTLKAGAGIQYSEYDADRRTIGGHSYDEKYSDMTYDIYLNGRYFHNIGNNLFLEPYGTLSYTYINQDGTGEGNKALAIETDSKSFDYTTAKVGVDLKKVIPHEKGKSTLSAGVSYTRLLSGADEEYITGRFKGGSDFDILVAHKNEHSIGLNAKYTLELENGVLFDVKGIYAVERDSHNGTGKNKTKGEWIVGAGLGYKF